MSRIGKMPVAIPSGVKVTVASSQVTVEGKLGKITESFPSPIGVAVEGEQVLVTRQNDEQKTRAFHGLIRSLIANAVKGVSEGYSKSLEIQGVGYRAAVKGKVLDLTLGFSHPVEFKIPEGITIEVPAPTQVIIKGFEKQRVGQVAAEIRKIRPPEPYKGKGVRYTDEHIRRKVGKTGAK